MTIAYWMKRKNILQHKLIICILVFVFNLNSVIANDVLTVVNTFTGQNTYEVVYESTKNTTDQPVGIYAITKKGKVTPVIKGHVLGVNRGFNGFVEQASNSVVATQDLATSMAIVDGKLVVFNKNTNSADPKKLPLYLGSKGFEVFDPNTGLPIKDGIEITNLDNFTLIKVGQLTPRLPLNLQGQIYLLSIKQKNSFGNGLTLAFVLETPNISDLAPKVLHGSAFVLSYDYMNDGVLKNLVQASGYDYAANMGFLASPNAVRSMLQRYKHQKDNPLISLWTKDAESYLTSIQNTKISSGTESNKTDALVPRGVQLFDIVTQNFFYASLPAIPLSLDDKDDLKLVQVFDPQNESWVVFDQSNFNSVQIQSYKKLKYIGRSVYNLILSRTIPGQVNFDDRGKYKITPLDSKNKIIGQQEYLINVGGSSVFLLRSKINGHLKSVNIPNFQVLDYRMLDVLHMSQVAPEGETGHFHHLLISMISKTGKKSLLAVGLKESEEGEISYAHSGEIGSVYISRDEMILRSKLSSNTKSSGLFLDIEKPYLGAAAYKKQLLAKKGSLEISGGVDAENDNAEQIDSVDTGRLVKYLHLPNKKLSGARKSAYLRAAKLETAISNGVLTYLQFGNKNVESADGSSTGFYFDFTINQGKINDQSLVLERPLFHDVSKQFVSGRPLYYQRKKQFAPMALDYAHMHLSNRGDVDISVVPYAPSLKLNSSTSAFKLLVTANTVGRSKESIPTSYSNLDVPADFNSLIGAKIVKGVRSNSNQFHILLFFGKDGHSTTGVFSISGFADLVYRNGEQLLDFKIINSGAWLTRDTVNPSEITLRLKANAAGNYYWIDTPEQPTDSLKLRVRELINPRSLLYVNKVNDGHERIQLRFDEEIGGEKGASDLYGKWQVIARYELNTRYPWFKQYTESLSSKLKSKSKSGKSSKESDDDFRGSFGSSFISDDQIAEAHKVSSPHFVEYLESIGRFKESLLEVNSGLKPRRQILLVEERMKAALLNDLMMQLYGRGKKFSLMPDRKGKFNFYGYDVTSTLEESLRELESISLGSVRTNTVLFSTIEEINSASPLVQDDSKKILDEIDTNDNNDGQSTNEDSEDDKRQKKLSRWLLLATEGAKSDLALLHKKITPGSVKIPTIIIGTPQELMTAMGQNSVDLAAGVFDSFEINYEFLTSSWMLWSPGSEFAIPQINDLSQLSISEEEHRVFPEIDRIVTQAGNGELTGKQKVLIVSKELKPLINKLIKTRWASQSLKTTSSSSWHYSNDKLLVYSLMGDRSVNSQDKVFENFQAMRGGAKYKSVVLLADLENINAIGRPFNAEGRNFMLKDPLAEKTSVRSDFITIESEIDKSVDSEDSEARESIQAQITSLKETLSATTNDTEKRDLTSTLQALENRASNLDRDLSHSLTGFSATDQQAMPHLMWLIATEGEKVQPKSTREWSVKKAVDRKLATLLIATPEEWAIAEQNMTFEAKYFDPKDHFDFVELDSPSEQTKFNLVRSLFLRPEIKSLDYGFIISNNSGEDAERQLISHFVNRVEQIALQQNLESTAAFIKAFAELKRTLVEDTSLRRSRIIDKNFLERLFFKIFPLPISIENLEANDPLNRLQNIQEAARKLQQLGYHGAMDLKERTLETILNQTRGSDAGRPIPNSQIYFGGTSSGKTFLFKKTVEMLGLTAYNPNKANNEDAEYIIISVQNLVEDASKEAGKMTVDDAIEMIQDLISQPKGHRAFILFDDAHKTSSKVVHQKLYSFIQSLFEAPSGLIRVKKKGTNEFKEVPVQNLNLYMTVNPTANKQQKEKYADGDKLNRLVLAALANHGIDMEESMLARWSDIINLDQFPRGAKVPALVERVRRASSTTSSTVLVDAKVIDALVEKYPDENAREFLAPAASALTRIPIDAEKSSLYIVTRRKKTANEDISGDVDRVLDRNGGFLTSTELNKTVKELTQVEAILINKPDSLAKLMEFLIGNFRMQVFNYTILSAQNTELLRLNISGQSTVLQRNFVLSAMTHVLKNPSLPLNEVKIMGEDFAYLNETELQELVEVVLYGKSSDKPYFPFDVNLRENLSNFGFFSLLGLPSSRDSAESHRNKVMVDTLSEIEKIFRRMLRLYVQMPNGDLSQTLGWGRDDIVGWYENLSPHDPVEEYKQLTQDLILVYKKFIENFNNNDFVESRQPMIAELSFYDYGRMFSYLIDKALTRLPWGLTSKFVLDVMNEASDLSLGQKPNFINYAYNNEISPLAIVTTDFLNETYSSEVKDRTRVDELDSGFKSHCEILLRSGEAGK